MEEGRGTTEKENLEGEARTALQTTAETLPSTEFVKVEKNLASLGFFTPSSKRTRNEKSKTVSVTIVLDGKRIEAKATIAPTALFGLPITADQDKWLALHKILADIQIRDGKVTNPVSFSSAELLALLKIYKDSGKNYKDVSEWLDVMVGTTIISEGAVYFAGKRTFGKDTFHVFDRAVSFGKELPNGSIADKNYVWLSQWQLQNINDHHQLPIDLDTYRQLRNYIAKALVPLLQIWLYATRNEGVFEKRYDELCQILNIRQWDYPSKIREKLGPSLDELKEFGYLADWQIGRMSDNRSYKSVLYHGEKFHRDRRARLGKKLRPREVEQQHAGHDRLNGMSAAQNGRHQTAPKQNSPALESPASHPAFDPILVAELTRRGINEKKAHELLANLKPGQDVVAQLEHAEQIVEHSQIPITNPAGYIVRLIEWNTPVPDGFETSAKRKARDEQEQKDRERRAAHEAEQKLEWEYEAYRDAEVDRYIAANATTFEAIKNAKWEEDRQRFSFTTESMARLAARFEVQKQLPLLTFEEFVSRKQQAPDLFLKPVGLPADAETLPDTPTPQDVAANDKPVQAPPDTAATDPEREAVIPPAPEAATEPAMSEPVIELVSEPAHQEPDSNPAGEGIA